MRMRSGSRRRSARKQHVPSSRRSRYWRVAASHTGTFEYQNNHRGKPGSVLNLSEDPHRLVSRWHCCLFGVWRSVGSPPPDKAVRGRPSYVLPVWRNVIIMRPRGSLRDRSIPEPFEIHASVDREMYALKEISYYHLKSPWQSPT